MPRKRRPGRPPRLSWFPFFVNDFYGGVAALSAPEVGCYVSLLCAQWGSKDRKAITADPERLRLICALSEPSAAVLEKFIEVEIEGHKYLRNERLAAEWDIAKAEYEAKVSAAQATHAALAEHGAKRNAKRPPEETHSARESESEPDVTTTYLPTARARAEAKPFQNPADDQTEREIRKLQLELGGLLARLAEHHNSRLMVPAWCKRVTRYGKGEGVADYRTIRSIGRLEKSIEDAKWWLSKMEGGRIVDGAR